MYTPTHLGLQFPRSLIVVGASTGGTRVVAQILSLLPPLSAAVVVVQHMPRFINDTFARTLSAHAQAEVRLARELDLLAENCVFVAPSGVHCTLVHNRSIRLQTGPTVNYVCPAIDVTMQSLRAPPAGQQLIGVLLTGMGKDGAAGLAHIKRLGGLTIAQDQATCAVYGMPAQAVKLGCVDYQLPPEGIARRLASLVN